MKTVILTLLLISSIEGTLPGEITPVSAEQSLTLDSTRAAGRAIDGDLTTDSVIGSGSDGTAWVKVNLGRVYCVDTVIAYWGSNTWSKDTYSCTQQDCSSCEGSGWCGYYLVSVYNDSTTSTVGDIPSTTNCRLGDTVKLYSEQNDIDIQVNEVVILAKLADLDCTELDPTWNNVITDTPLPAEHETVITLGCAAGYTNNGGDTATCQDGTIVPDDTPPLCNSSSEELSPEFWIISTTLALSLFASKSASLV